MVNPNNEILVVRNVASGMWGFPKGHQEPGELPIDTALRELEEETGKQVDPQIFTSAFCSRKDWLYFARGEFVRECVVDGVEIDQYDWITLRELRARKTSKFTQKFFARIDYAIKCKK